MKSWAVREKLRREIFIVGSVEAENVRLYRQSKGSDIGKFLFPKRLLKTKWFRRMLIRVGRHEASKKRYFDACR